jgi:hypothetical protein
MFNGGVDAMRILVEELRTGARDFNVSSDRVRAPRFSRSSTSRHRARRKAARSRGAPTSSVSIDAR